MAEMTSVKSKQIEFVESSDVSLAAQTMLDQALQFCMAKAHLADREAAVRALRAGEAVTSGYFYYSLARSTGEYLGTWDHDVKAVYAFDYEATPEDVCFGETRHPLVHLIVWVERKTAALVALATTLDRALVEQVGSLLEQRERQYVLDVQIVDNDEVANRTGYGAVLASIRPHAMQVWGR